MEEDIRRNFEFLYFGRGRHLAPDYAVLDRPFQVLEQLEAIERLKIRGRGMDEVTSVWGREFSFDVRVFIFPGHSIEAHCTREGWPEHPKKPSYITRIRLGNYNFADPFSRQVSEALSSLPKSD